MPDLRSKIQIALNAFEQKPLKESALGLLAVLGYKSDRTLNLGSSKPKAFVEFLNANSGGNQINETKALVSDWKSADLLFQLTDNELSGQRALFDEHEVSPSLLKSYVFFAIELTGDNYARGKLTDIARQINRVFPMPVMVLIKHKANKSPVLSIAVINRRANKRDTSRDVLGKVTIIRDVAFSETHRGHLDILDSFAIENLIHPQRLPINNFDNLHTAWEEVFNVELLNKRFYKELANWYFWALPQVEFPADVSEDDEKRRATSLIRLLTRLIFCWFLKEKGLVPESLFNETDLKSILKELKSDSSSYYHAILQNLFFGTLNQRMGKDSKGNPYRAFAKDEGFHKNKNTYGVDNLYRYEDCFKDPDAALELFADIPFLNGGLFECLDRTDPKTEKKIYIDGFSRNKKKRPSVPNHLFFSDEQSGIDLSTAYGERSRRNEKVRGLIRILSSYKFTIVENTPIDQEIALDPELLGKVFENLLASYNEETKTTARKQTGSFYTPRPIVEYMVDESLKAYLTTALTEFGMAEDAAKSGLETLFAYTEEPHPFSDRQVDKLLEAIHTCKVLDPACGSGAFPMGMLQKLVYIIHKLDPANEKWMQIQIDKASEIPDSSARDAAIKAIEQDFADNEDDYGRKLYLIENCLYGVDIQPIAIQISKLRFFISLVCDQKTNRSKRDNLGIRPLPNLETKFVAADTLIGLKKNAQLELFESGKVKELEKELQRVRHDHFATTTRQRKIMLQGRDKEIRDELAKQLQHSTFWDQTTARKLATWDPFDPQASADYFEPLWMFDRSLQNGFDIVVGNPPYVDSEAMTRIDALKRSLYTERFSCAQGNWDLFILFVERGINLLASAGSIALIVPNKLLGAPYSESIRRRMLKTSVREIRDYSRVRVFKDADVYPIVFVCTNREEKRAVAMTVMETEEIASSTKLISESDFYGGISWARYFASQEGIDIDQRVSKFQCLGDFFPTICGAATVAEAYEIREIVKDKNAPSERNLFRLINTGTIDPYVSYWGIQKIRYIKGAFLHPIVSRSDLAAINPRRVQQADSEKLIIGGMTKILECFYDNGGYLAGKSTTIVLPGRKLPLYYAAAVLNSKLISYWYRIRFKALTLAGGYLRISPNEIKQIPIPVPSSKDLEQIKQFVDVIRKDPSSSEASKSIEALDDCIFRIYGFSDVEAEPIKRWNP